VINFDQTKLTMLHIESHQLAATASALNLHHVHLAPQLGVTLFEFCRDFRNQKTRVHGLSCGVVCMIQRLAVSVEHRLVTGGQTDTRQWLIPALASVAQVKTVNSEPTLCMKYLVHMNSIHWHSMSHNEANKSKQIVHIYISYFLTTHYVVSQLLPITVRRQPIFKIISVANLQWSSKIPQHRRGIATLPCKFIINHNTYLFQITASFQIS